MSRESLFQCSVCLGSFPMATLFQCKSCHAIVCQADRARHECQKPSQGWVEDDEELQTLDEDIADEDT